MAAYAGLIANSGGHFDPSCVAVFVARWEAVVKTFHTTPELLARA